MERDPKTGHFLPGNQIAVGNKGNAYPKWGNKNANKHGFHATFNICKILDDGCLYIFLSRENAVKIKPDKFLVTEDGRIAIHDDVVPWLERFGVKLEY